MHIDVTPSRSATTAPDLDALGRMLADLGVAHDQGQLGAGRGQRAGGLDVDTGDAP
jgi:hypothetical protein